MGFNKKVLSKAVSELDKAKAPAKPRDITVDPMGYWNPANQGKPVRVPGGDDINGMYITMHQVSHPIWAQPNVGPGAIMYPEENRHFSGASYVDETPIGRKGGTLKSKKYSKSISATNKLFVKNKLFQKKKSKIFDPNAEFKSGGSKLGPINLNPNPLSHYELNYGFNLPTQEIGGENEDEYMDLTDKEIQAYRDGGYVVEELPENKIGGYVQHELVKAQKGKTVKTFKRDIRDQDALSNTGWSSAPVEKKKVVTTKKTPTTLKEKLNQTPQQAFDNDFKIVTAKENAILKEKTREQNNAFKNQQMPGYKDYGPQSAGSADWFWTLPIAGPAALEAVSSIGAMSLPGLSSVPGATVGNLFNASTIAEGINQTPETIKAWNDVAKGKKSWSDAALETGINLSEFIGSGAGIKSIVQDLNQGTKYLGKTLGTETGLLSNAYKVNPFAFKPNPTASYRMLGKNGLEDARQSGVFRSNQVDIYDPYTNNKAFDEVYYSQGVPFDGRKYKFSQDLIDKTSYAGTKNNRVWNWEKFKGPHMVEVNNSHNMPNFNTYGASPLENFGYEITTSGNKPVLFNDPNVNIYKQHWLYGYKKIPTQSTTNAPVRSGLGSMDMSKYEIKNPDYYAQLLGTYNSKTLSSKNKKFYKDLIGAVKNQNGLVTERQYNELQRLKSGNFNFDKKAYEEGGSIEEWEDQLDDDQIKELRRGGYVVEELD